MGKVSMEKGKTPGMIGLLIYVCLSALGLTLIKVGTNKGSSLILNSSGISLQLNWILVLGMVVYVVSFLTSMVVMKSMDLSLFYPLSAGLIYIIICLLSFLVLHESIPTQRLIGMTVILVGIIIMNIGRK